MPKEYYYLCHYGEKPTKSTVKEFATRLDYAVRTSQAYIPHELDDPEFLAEFLEAAKSFDEPNADANNESEPIYQLSDWA